MSESIIELMLSRMSLAEISSSARLHSIDYALTASKKICDTYGDIYYLPFAFASLKALGYSGDFDFAKDYLENLNTQNFDLIHLSSYCRAARLAGFKHSKRIGNFEAHTPYELFVKIGAMQDCQEAFAAEELSQKLSLRKLPSGGYSNVYGSKFAGANATSAAIVAEIFLTGKSDFLTQKFLMSLQDKSGGFLAQIDSPYPDLLSTATALFALWFAGGSAKYSSKDFVYAHSVNDGSFSASVFDASGDVEYLFYALLALGSQYE